MSKDYRKSLSSMPSTDTMFLRGITRQQGMRKSGKSSNNPTFMMRKDIEKKV